jgi:cobyrinic acid a,c-diamide synthase
MNAVLKIASDVPVLSVVIETKSLELDNRHLSLLRLVTIFRYLKL